MADPVTMMAAISMGTAAAGAGVSAFGSYQGGRAEQNMDAYRARVAQINASIAGEQAGAEEAAGGIRAQIYGLGKGEQIGETRAKFAAGNLGPGGTAGKVLSSETENAQFGQSTILNEAERKAYGYRVGAFSDTAQAQLDVAAGQQARTAADFGVASSLLGGATSVSDKWTKYTETMAPQGIPNYGDPSVA